ncbi:MAG: hypothetical protein H0W74_09405 [Sphingosinicella sp.]|nr:hypothetical protein [Sphingosinicella sp.]
MISLHSLVEAELAEPVDPRVSRMADAIAAEYPAAARAVLFYGSCLRTSDLDGLMLDFYLIVSDYSSAYGKSWMATANRLIPPNVFPFQHDGLAAKYAVLSQADLARECGPEARSVSVWARFAQPARLVWSSDPKAADQVAEAVAKAAPTLFRLTLPMMDKSEPAPLETWKAGFALTYGAELRAERTDRSSNIVNADPERYDRFGRVTLDLLASGDKKPLAAPGEMARLWRRMQRKGKLLSVLRLAKASGTFAGGIDYIAWKINRHAGTEISIKPWQRRWPLIGAITLLPLLLKRGAIR